MDEPNYRIVLIPRVPEDPHLDILFRTKKGFAAQATEEDVQALKKQNIAVVELYANPEEYAGAMVDATREQALAAVESIQDEAIAALEPSDRDQFSVA